MKTNITKEDVLALREELNKYIEKSTPQEAEGLGLALISVGGAIYLFDKLTTEDLNAMFRGVYGIIGKDFSEYKKEEEQNGRIKFYDEDWDQQKSSNCQSMIVSFGEENKEAIRKSGLKGIMLVPETV